MKSIEIFRKMGYKQTYNNGWCVIYCLKQKTESRLLPDTIVISKIDYDVDFYIENEEEKCQYSFHFFLTKELVQAINMKIQELIEEKNN